MKDKTPYSGLINALRGQNTQGPPVWLMRQAGRYMPEYRAIREKHSFLEMCHHPEIAAEVTQLPIRCFGFDAAILFSDILVISEALGIPIRFEDGVGPIIEHPITSNADIVSLQIREVPSILGYVSEAIQLVKPQISVPLIGFSGAPFTVASYLIEGKSSHDLKKTKRWLFQNPESLHQLLEIITTCTIDYLKMQIASGVDAIQIFDSWACFLGPESFRSFSYFYLKRILDALKEYKIPIILFCRGSAAFLPQLVELHPSGISIDWSCDLSHIRKSIPSSIAIQGNLDPFILYSTKSTVRKEVSKLLTCMQGDPAYIFNLGHGIFPDTPVEAVKTLVETIKERR